MSKIKQRRETINKEIESRGLSYANKNLMLRMLSKIEEYETITNTDLEDFTEKELLEMIKRMNSTSRLSVYQYIHSINHILSILELDHIKIESNNIEDSEVAVSKITNYDESKYFTKEEIKDICDLLLNPQDKFIIYGMFCGVVGKENKDLREIKSENIDLVKKEIYVPDRVIIMDDYMYDICNDMLDREFGSVYYRYLDPDKDSTRVKDSYELNFDSPYAIKTRPASYNNFGMNPISDAGIKTRIKALGEFTGLSLSRVGIIRSGIMHRMNKIKKVWTKAEVSEFLKQSNFKGEPSELHRIYNFKYNNK